MTHRHAFILLLAATGFWACGGCAQQTIDPQADAALRRMGETLAAAKGVSFHAVGLMDEEARTGQWVQILRQSEILVRRPDGLHAEIRGDDLRRTIWYDGRTLTVLDLDARTVAVVDAKDTIARTHDYLVDKYGLTMPLADFICGNAYETMKANVQTGLYIGVQEIDGHACDHLAFTQEAINWQIWIDKAKSVPRKLVITYKLEAGRPNFTATMSRWLLAADVSEAPFKPVLPADVKRVELAELLGVAEGE